MSVLLIDPTSVTAIAVPSLAIDRASGNGTTNVYACATTMLGGTATNPCQLVPAYATTSTHTTSTNASGHSLCKPLSFTVANMVLVLLVFVLWGVY
ncbi:hypothetical protein BABINDRAFT_160363 [Babjeviella inositovora NRRL Y-12698]|uniref:Uncharacterized protein n=1 Tax=Babjeviella inositovora NRRL Y-12698 TaxID=984486 RepID=A0A1E3QT96_9ASCO|nr:uncharacterized protein BABINDRAFT_160363 [Babjeviella inositovora NRRL Y-12698]ODQ80926.1 hypothetical protein BABINDRAFT_160363 [Babjeviella inositovora NRRL Y-12698]